MTADHGAPPVPPTGDLDATLETVEARLEGLEDLSVDLQVRTLAAVEADLRTSLETARS